MKNGSSMTYVAIALVVGLIIGYFIGSSNKISQTETVKVSSEESTSPTESAQGKPSEGFTLHIDAMKHFPGKPEMIAHHYCKAVAGGLTECQLYDSDDRDARLAGVEVVVGPAMYNNFDATEKAQWHYHKDEIPKVDAKLPDLSEEEAAKVVKSLEETYGKIYLLWDPGKTDQPVGKPFVNILP